MKQISLQAQSRTDLGRSASRQSRSSGSIPAVIYGESGVKHLSVGSNAFKLAWREVGGRAALIELHFDGEEESHFAIIQEVQRDARTDSFEHIDFKEVVRGHEMEAHIPVRTRGISPGVKNMGGVLEVNHDEIQVRCLPRNLPEFIEVDVTKLSIGDSVHLRDIAVPEGVLFLEDMDLVIVSCSGSSAGASEAAAEGTTLEAAATAAKA